MKENDGKRHRSKEHRRKISEANKGRIFSEEHRRKIGLAGKGREPSSSCFTKNDPRLIGKNNTNYKPKIQKICPICNIEFEVIPSNIRIKCCSKNCSYKYRSLFTSPWNKGLKCVQVAWNKGIPSSTEAKRKNSEAHQCPRPWMLGRIVSLETKEKLRLSHIGQISPKKGKKFPQYSGENHPNWKGGVSYEKYGIEFNESLKKNIRKRDNYTCQVCEITEQDTGKSHICHHIDYNKKNNDPDNIISTCNSCHSKTNFNRDYWTNFFKELKNDKNTRTKKL